MEGGTGKGPGGLAQVPTGPWEPLCCCSPSSWGTGIPNLLCTFLGCACALLTSPHPLLGARRSCHFPVQCDLVVAAPSQKSPLEGNVVALKCTDWLFSVPLTVLAGSTCLHLFTLQAGVGRRAGVMAWDSVPF